MPMSWARCWLTHIGRTIFHSQRGIAAYVVKREPQIEACIGALDRARAQQRCELPLVLRGKASQCQERGSVCQLNPNQPKEFRFVRKVQPATPTM